MTTSALTKDERLEALLSPERVRSGLQWGVPGVGPGQTAGRLEASTGSDRRKAHF